MPNDVSKYFIKPSNVQKEIKTRFGKIGTLINNYNDIKIPVIVITSSAKKDKEKKQGILKSIENNIKLVGQILYDFPDFKKDVDSEAKNWIKRVGKEINVKKLLNIKMNEISAHDNILCKMGGCITRNNELAKILNANLEILGSQEKNIKKEIDENEKLILNTAKNMGLCILDTETIYKLWDETKNIIDESKDRLEKRIKAKNVAIEALLQANRRNFLKSHKEDIIYKIGSDSKLSFLGKDWNKILEEYKITYKLFDNMKKFKDENVYIWCNSEDKQYAYNGKEYFTPQQVISVLDEFKEKGTLPEKFKIDTKFKTIQTIKNANKFLEEHKNDSVWQFDQKADWQYWPEGAKYIKFKIEDIEKLKNEKIYIWCNEKNEPYKHSSYPSLMNKDDILNEISTGESREVDTSKSKDKVIGNRRAYFKNLEKSIYDGYFAKFKDGKKASFWTMHEDDTIRKFKTDGWVPGLREWKESGENYPVLDIQSGKYKDFKGGKVYKWCDPNGKSYKKDVWLDGSKIVDMVKNAFDKGVMPEEYR